MNTLEDAFVNIGMDEERILNRNEHENNQKNDKYTDFENIVVPDSCYRGKFKKPANFYFQFLFF